MPEGASVCFVGSKLVINIREEMYMKRSTGRFISILLALVLVVSLFAIPVAAETKGVC